MTILIVVIFVAGFAYVFQKYGGLHKEDKTVYPSDTQIVDPAVASDPTKAYIDNQSNFAQYKENK